MEAASSQHLLCQPAHSRGVIKSSHAVRGTHEEAAGGFLGKFSFLDKREKVTREVLPFSCFCVRLNQDVVAGCLSQLLTIKGQAWRKNQHGQDSKVDRKERQRWWHHWATDQLWNWSVSNPCSYKLICCSLEPPNWQTWHLWCFSYLLNLWPFLQRIFFASYCLLPSS